MQDGTVEVKKVYGGMGAAIEALGADPNVVEEVTPPEPVVIEPELKVIDKQDNVLDYNTLEKDVLITKIKDFEKLTSDREKTILELQKGKDDGSASSEDEILLKALSEDFIGNYDKAKERFKLPSISTLKELISEGNIDDKIKHWQDNELVKSIERKHRLEAGEFEYDSNEASKAGTPSYDWDTMTSDKRSELVGSLRERQSAEARRLRTVTEQQTKDMDWLAETYFDNKPEAVQEKVKAMNTIVDEIAQGLTTPDKHPLAIRNLVRGVHFDELAKGMVDKAINDLIQQFAEHQMYLPGKELPTDVTKISGAPPEIKLEIDENKRKVSPMLNSIYNSANRK